MRASRFATVLFGLTLATQVVRSGPALATQNELSFSARIGETIAYTPTAPRIITGLLVVPPDGVATVRLLDERTRIEVDCLREGVTTITLQIRDGSVVSTVTLRVECRGRSFEHAPGPGGAAQDPVRFITGRGTYVEGVDCSAALNCDLANLGQEGGFQVRCVGLGSASGTYRYQYFRVLPTGEVRLLAEVKTRGKFNARCPRD